MRIGIDLVGLQADGDGARRRCLRSFLRSLLDFPSSFEFVLYQRLGLPHPGVFAPAGHEVRMLAFGAQGEQAASTVDDLVGGNPHDLDWLLLTGPIDAGVEFRMPSASPFGPKLAAVIDDLADFAMLDDRLPDTELASRLYRQAQVLKGYDLIVTFNEFTSRECREVLGVATAVAVTLPIADLRTPARLPFGLSHHAAVESRGVVATVVDGRPRFAFNNVLNAFAKCSGDATIARRLIVIGNLSLAQQDAATHDARARGVEFQYLSDVAAHDDQWAAMLDSADVLIHAARYDGLGYRLVEALARGVPIIAGNNSAQPETVGDAAILVNLDDPDELQTALAAVLSCTETRRLLRENGIRRASALAAASPIGSFVAAIERCTRSDRVAVRRRVKRRIALFSPFTPKPSGISEFAERLIVELAPDYTIDLFHDSGYVPHFALRNREFAAFDYRLYPRLARCCPYDLTLYQMGNSGYHRHVYESLMRYPGVVALHDFALVGFYCWHAWATGVGMNRVFDEIGYEEKKWVGAARSHASYASWEDEPGGLRLACLRRGFYLNRRILEQATHAIVFNQWEQQRIAERLPDILEKTTVIPPGVDARPTSAERRAATRRRFQLPIEAIVFGAFGSLHPVKLNVETVKAFARIASRHRDAVCVFVGKDLGNGEARQAAQALGLGDRVRFFGFTSADDFESLVASVDVGLNLRRPPTHGEVGGPLLLLLAAAVATIVVDCDTFSTWPDSMICKVRYDKNLVDHLTAAMDDLAGDPVRRRALGEAAGRHVHEHLAWPQIGQKYVELFERLIAKSHQRGSRHKRSSHVAAPCAVPA